MTEWGVVGVIIALVGLVSTFVGISIKLTKVVTKLDVSISGLQDELLQNRKSHSEMWTKMNRNNDAIANHETRISVLEHSEKKSER